ncbi:hypothetical protein HAX54_039219, partial [Datura stramonium]|nr:hypothetical protein [Datura stramonium]
YTTPWIGKSLRSGSALTCRTLEACSKNWEHDCWGEPDELADRRCTFTYRRLIVARNTRAMGYLAHRSRRNAEPSSQTVDQSSVARQFIVIRGDDGHRLFIESGPEMRQSVPELILASSHRFDPVT